VPSEPGPPWWQGIAPGWDKDDTDELLRLLAHAYPSPADLPSAPRDLSVPAELSNAISPDDPWVTALRHVVAERQVGQFIKAVLDDQWEKESAGALVSLLEMAGESRSGLEKNSSDNGEPADGEEVIEVYNQLMLRTVIVEVNESLSGTGCLIGDQLVLTCQHVVEESRGKIADPSSIEVRFDFNRRRRTTYVENGQRVQVSAVISSSPPTDADRNPVPGSYRGADADHLDYAILELSAPAPAPAVLTHAEPTERGHYRPHSTRYRFRATGRLVLAHHPEASGIKFSDIDKKPEFDYSATRIAYQCKTKPGSSGGPIVNMQGRLVALHQGIIVPDQAAAETANAQKGIPISAIAEDLKKKGLGDVVKPENVTYIGRYRYSRHAREQVCLALSDDLSTVTRYLMVPDFIDTPYTLWDWLEKHNKLRKLRSALEAADRGELVRILDADRVIVDRAQMDQIGELAESVLRSATEAGKPGTFTVAMNRVRRLSEKLALTLRQLPSFVGDDRVQLQWEVEWNAKFDTASFALSELRGSLPALDAQPYQAQDNTARVLTFARKVQAAVYAMYELAEDPKLAAQ
jgi:V8-like Glu-specific endopeptidase